jgi:hypothetical protein
MVWQLLILFAFIYFMLNGLLFIIRFVFKWWWIRNNNGISYSPRSSSASDIRNVTGRNILILFFSVSYRYFEEGFDDKCSISVVESLIRPNASRTRSPLVSLAAQVIQSDIGSDRMEYRTGRHPLKILLNPIIRQESERPIRSVGAGKILQ